jgi:predicted secreted Zn-dependent protease
MRIISVLSSILLHKLGQLSDALKLHKSECLRLLICSAICMLPLVSFQANARLVIKEITKNYSVSGKTGKQVHAKLGRSGPWKMRRKHAIAATQRVLDFNNIKFASRGNKCVIVKMDIHLSLTYYYPRWTNKKFASKNSQKIWNRFLVELVRHEKVHGKLFKATARKIDKELKKISKKTYRNCRTMSSVVKSSLTKTFKKGRAKHSAFDRREKRSTAKVRKLEKAFYKSK